MVIIALETTGKYGSVAVINEKGEVTTASTEEELQHLQGLLPLATEVLGENHLTIEDVDAVACSVGPGSFTGIRVGVATARAWGQMLNIPCIPVSSLEGLAMRAMEDLDRRTEEAGGDLGQVIPGASNGVLIVTAINARRGQNYAALWNYSKQGVQFVSREKQWMILPLIEKAKKKAGAWPIYWTGDGVDAYGEELAALAGEHTLILAPEEYRYPTARTVAKVGWIKAQTPLSGSQPMLIPYERIFPNYLRKSEAEMKLEEGSLSKKIGTAAWK